MLAYPNARRPGVLVPHADSWNYRCEYHSLFSKERIQHLLQTVSARFLQLIHLFKLKLLNELLKPHSSRKRQWPGRLIEAHLASHKRASVLLVGGMNIGTGITVPGTRNAIDDPGPLRRPHDRVPKLLRKWFQVTAESFQDSWGQPRNVGGLCALLHNCRRSPKGCRNTVGGRPWDAWGLPLVSRDQRRTIGHLLRISRNYKVDS